MAVKVVDASAVAALLFGEPGAEAVAARLADARLIAPGLLGFELTNICWVKCCRHPTDAAALMAAFGYRDRLGITEMAVAHADVLILAHETGLTGYDASYLWLAREAGAELVTLDRQLANAAGAERA